MTAPSDPVTHVEWRDTARAAFPSGREDIHLHPGVNRISARNWTRIRDGAAKEYVRRSLLVEVPAPVDEVAAAKVHDADVKRGITPTPTSARHRRGSAHDQDARFKAMEAQIAALTAQLQLASMAKPDSQDAPAEPELAFDPSDATLDELPELLEGLTGPQITALIAAEKGGKKRKGALATMAEALIAL